MGAPQPAEAVIQADGQHVYVLADAVIEHARKTGIVKELFESPIQQIVRMHEEQLAAIDDWIEALRLKDQPRPKERPHRGHVDGEARGVPASPFTGAMIRDSRALIRSS